MTMPLTKSFKLTTAALLITVPLLVTGCAGKNTGSTDYGLPELNKKASETDRTLRSIDRLNRTMKRILK